jgi:hypothetical protein
MTDRHLLPDEIDQLLDSEVGFGTAPLAAHLRDCPTCRAGYEAARRCVEAIERLPLPAPSPLFAHHVMAQVNVFQPWDVAAHDAIDHLITRLVPSTPRMRVLVGGLGLSIAAVVTAACIWLGGHLDAVFFFGAMARTRLRDAVLQQLGSLVTAVFGPQSADALGRGGPAFVLGVLATAVLATIAAGYVVRSLVTTRRVAGRRP